MMNKLIVLIAAALLIVGCQNKVKNPDQPPGGWDVTVRGKVGYPKKGTIRISELRSPDSVNPFSDSIALDMSTYSFEKTLHLYEPGMYRLDFYGIQSVDFFLHDTDIEVNVDGNDPTGFVEVKGSPDHDLITRVQTMLRDGMASPQVTKLEAEFQKVAQEGNMKRVLELQEEYADLKKQTNDSIVDMLSTQPPSLALLSILQSNLIDDKDPYFDFYKETAARFTKEWPNSPHGKEFEAMVNAMAVTAVGVMAPEISLPDPNGNIVTLSSLKGKYVLVDFWAKWCGPCRRENPNVVKAYNKFKGEAFEILGVSLDRNREDWLKAISEDGLTWTHVSDLKYFDSQAAIDYNISAIPFSILVDPSGRIIDKNLRGSKLHKRLSEIFKKS